MNKKPVKAAKAKTVTRRAPAFIGGMWTGAALGVGLLYTAGLAVISDFSSFRACSSNSNGLTIKSCGKQSVNLGDAVLLGLFIVAAALAASMVTAAWRVTRRTA